MFWSKCSRKLIRKAFRDLNSLDLGTEQSEWLPALPGQALCWETLGRLSAFMAGSHHSRKLA